MISILKNNSKQNSEKVSTPKYGLIGIEIVHVFMHRVTESANDSAAFKINKIIEDKKKKKKKKKASMHKLNKLQKRHKQKITKEKNTSTRKTALHHRSADHWSLIII